MNSEIIHEKLPTPGTVFKEVAGRIFRRSDRINLVPLDTSPRKVIGSDSKKSPLRCIMCSILIVTVVLLVFVMVTTAIFRIAYPPTVLHCGVIDYPYEINETNYDTGNAGQILTRNQWGGRDILDGYQNRTLVHPIKLVIIGHTASHQCMTVEDCSPRLQAIQYHHVRDLNYVDIKYNFLVGGDGHIYEALGWDIQNYLRNSSIQIQFIGNYEFDEVLERQLMAAKALLDLGVELGKLDKSYLIVAHKQVTDTKSPGKNLLAEMKRWPHYYGGSLSEKMQLQDE